MHIDRLAARLQYECENFWRKAEQILWNRSTHAGLKTYPLTPICMEAPRLGRRREIKIYCRKADWILGDYPTLCRNHMSSSSYRHDQCCYSDVTGTCRGLIVQKVFRFDRTCQLGTKTGEAAVSCSGTSNEKGDYHMSSTTNPSIGMDALVRSLSLKHGDCIRGYNSSLNLGVRTENQAWYVMCDLSNLCIAWKLQTSHLASKYLEALK